MIEDIEDNYPDYLDDELGYVWEAWDILPADAIRRHDEIFAMGAGELRALALDQLDDLELWAYARAQRRLGDQGAFLAALRVMFIAEGKHPAIDYADARASLIEALIDAGELPDAAQHLAEARSEFPDDPAFVRLEVHHAFAAGEEAGAATMASTIEAHGDDAELLYELAEDFARVGRPERARELLVIARRAAERHARAALVDIELLEQRLLLQDD